MGKQRIQSENPNSGEALRVSKSSDAILSMPQSDAALLESGWPWAGSIEFENVSMRYNSASPLVLRNVTVSVPAGTTLGVVGRTGSGKSSLLLTLFRIVELEGVGSITIDGVDFLSLPSLQLSSPERSCTTSMLPAGHRPRMHGAL